MKELNLKEYIKEKETYNPNSFEDHLIEQYKVMVDSTERVSDRRNSYNSFLLSIQTILITILGYLVTNKLDSFKVFIYFLLALGILIAIYWIISLNNYKQLNSGKFAVIKIIENELPIKLYELEWELLEKGKKRTNYLKSSMMEKVIPIFFIIAYMFIFILTLINF